MPSISESILITGATGTQGGAVARALLREGVAVHAFVRDPRSTGALALARAGARLAVGDLDEPSSIRAALEGRSACYAVTTPFEGGAEQEARQGENILAAALEADLPWLIFASVASALEAEVPHFASKARIERSLEASSLAWTIIAPTYFFENVLGAHGAIPEAELALALPGDTPLQQVALGDLAALVLAVLSRKDEHIGARIEVAADAPTPLQMSAALGVGFRELSIAELTARKPDLGAMFAFLAARGYAVDVPRLRAAYPEIAWQIFAEWAVQERRR